MKKILLIFLCVAAMTSCSNGAKNKTFPDVMIGTWAKSGDNVGGSITKQENVFYFTDDKAVRYPLVINSASSSLSLQYSLMTLNMKYVEDIDAVIVTNIESGKIDTTFRLK